MDDGGGGGGLCRQSSALWRSFRNGDFEEHDVWSVLNEKSTSTASKSFDDSRFFADSPKSAPRSIPPCCERIGSKSPRKFGSSEEEEEDDSSCGGGGDSEEEEGFESRVPPHELIARRLARAQISSFSVFEGVGRTLKGRDLSKVRNAVLTKTGFLESL